MDIRASSFYIIIMMLSSCLTVPEGLTLFDSLSNSELYVTSAKRARQFWSSTWFFPLLHRMLREERRYNNWSGCSLPIYYIFLLISYSTRQLLRSSGATYTLAYHFCFDLFRTFSYFFWRFSPLSLIPFLFPFPSRYHFRHCLPHFRSQSNSWINLFPVTNTAARKTSKSYLLMHNEIAKTFQVHILNFGDYEHRIILEIVEQIVDLSNHPLDINEAHWRALAESLRNYRYAWVRGMVTDHSFLPKILNVQSTQVLCTTLMEKNWEKMDIVWSWSVVDNKAVP